MCVLPAFILRSLHAMPSTSATATIIIRGTILF